MNEHNCEPNWLSKQMQCSNWNNVIRISVRWIDLGKNKPSSLNIFVKIQSSSNSNDIIEGADNEQRNLDRVRAALLLSSIKNWGIFEKRVKHREIP